MLWLVDEIFNYNNSNSDIVSRIYLDQAVSLFDFGIVNFMNIDDKKKAVPAIQPYGRMKVLLPIPVSQYYEYLNQDLPLRIGDLVEVPFGKRYLAALVIGSSNGSLDASKLKPVLKKYDLPGFCLLYTSPSPRDRTRSRMPSSA